MRNFRLFLAFALYASLVLVLISPASVYGILEGSREAEINSNGSSNTGGDSSHGGANGIVLEWQVLSKRNFSSQIRGSPHILLLVTLPWSGESRSLKKDVEELVSSNQEQLGHLKLMIVHKNTEKMLADVLDAKEELTLFYYHHSKRFKYRGRKNGRSILSSISYLMSFSPMEAPFKSLNRVEELENFMKSTDEAVFLLEFCGWTSKLMHKKNGESNDSSLSVQIFSENGDELKESTAIDDETLQSAGQDDLKGASYDAGTELGETPWVGGSIWGNVNSSVRGTGNRRGDNGIYCSMDEYKRFESFFPNFTNVARDTLLSPERFKFAHVSETSLLPFLGVEGPNTWMLLHWISACPNCSKVVQEVDDLRTILQMQHPPIVELDGDKNSNDFAFPANRPSVILFIDRLSKSSKVSVESKIALDAFRRFAQEHEISGQMIKGQARVGPNLSLLQGKSSSDAFSLMATKASSNNRIVKLSDKMTFMILNEDGKISMGKTSYGEETQGNSPYDLLMKLLQQKSPAVGNKETKLSLLAKEVGFQLISDDFKVQVMDSQPQHIDIDQSGSKTWKDTPLSEFPGEATEGDAIAADDSTQGSGLSAVEDTKQHQSIIGRSDSQQNLEVAVGDTKLMFSESTEVALKEKVVAVPSARVTRDENGSNEMGDGADLCQSEHSFCREQDTPTTELHDDKEHIHHKVGILYGSDSLDTAESSIRVFHDVAADEDDTEVQNDPMEVEKLKNRQIQHIELTASYFVSDGGYRLLEVLTGGLVMPSVVILDPVLQCHYVLSEAAELNYTLLAAFIYRFINGSLSPYQHSESVFTRPRQAPEPPFVNLDFHEADSIPKVTASNYLELVQGFNQCNMGTEVPSSNDRGQTCASKKDVLVLFSNSWCGFCQRMDLVVREVYRALQGFTCMLKSGRMTSDLIHRQDNLENVSLNEPPSILYMDCTLNDCTSLLEYLGKRENYPALVLFPAEKDAIFYNGDISVNSVIEFITDHGSHSQYLKEYQGILWTQRQKGGQGNDDLRSAPSVTVHDITFGADDHDEHLDHTLIEGDKNQAIGLNVLDEIHVKRPHVVIGSVLSATEKLLHAFPFDNSSVLVVRANQNEGIHGLIINKRINWNIFEEQGENFEHLKEAPLFYGGPVRVHNLPLVSLSRNAAEGYSEVATGLYFGDPLFTSQAIEGIRSGNKSANDYWFFLGFSGWEWNQLFGEIDQGDWNLSSGPIKHLNWPEN